jgi:hypothetical protein
MAVKITPGYSGATKSTMSISGDNSVEDGGHKRVVKEWMAE